MVYSHGPVQTKTFSSGVPYFGDAGEIHDVLLMDLLWSISSYGYCLVLVIQLAGTTPLAMIVGAFIIFCYKPRFDIAAENGRASTYKLTRAASDLLRIVRKEYVSRLFARAQRCTQHRQGTDVSEPFSVHTPSFGCLSRMVEG